MSPLSPVSLSTIHRILSDEHSPSINQYTSAGFIVWYSFVIMCCGVPLFCLSIWYFCKRCRVDGALDGDGFMMGRDMDLEIARIEANVDAFSEIEKKRKKVKLLQAFKKHTETVTKDQKQDPNQDQDEVHPCKPPPTATAATVLVTASKQPESDFESELTMGCLICLGKYEENDKVIQSANPSCRHMFHQQCILEWLSSRDAPECPCCRQHFVGGGTSLEPRSSSVLPSPPADQEDTLGSDDTSEPSTSSDGEEV